VAECAIFYIEKRATFGIFAYMWPECSVKVERGVHSGPSNKGSGLGGVIATSPDIFFLS